MTEDFNSIQNLPHLIFKFTEAVFGAIQIVKYFLRNLVLYVKVSPKAFL